MRQQKEKTGPDYRISVRVQANAQGAFKALTQEIGNWWGKADTPTKGIGDVFTVSWGEPWYQFRAIEYLPAKKVSWECIDANQIIRGLEGVKKEWVGTRLHWTFREINPNEIEVTLVHEGLVPEFICYEVCSTTWDSFVTIHLKNYLESS